MTSRSLIIAIAVIVIITVVGGVYYFSGPASISPQTTPESKPTTTEPKETFTTPDAKKETPPTMVDGTVLYKENCEGCHGARGAGGTAPELSSNVDKSIIENGNIEKGMPAFKDKLTPEEITAIMNYLARAQLTH